MDYIWFILGLITLVVAGEILVKGAVGVATSFKISPLVVGMTVVSMGTSMPELLVSIKAALGGVPDIAIGNVLGSNVANIALVMGLSALIFPLAVEADTLKFDYPAMMIATFLLYVFMFDLNLELWEGIIFVILLVSYIVFIIRKSRKENISIELEEGGKEKSKMGLNILFVFIGCVGLVYGADWLVNGATGIAKQFGVSDLVIGTTVVAFGTSVPELVTSCIAAFRKQTDISVGNLIGSNLFNILAILGITSIIKEIPINSLALSRDVLWVIGVSAILLPMMYIGKKVVNRFYGLVLLVGYGVFVYLVIV